MSGTLFTAHPAVQDRGSTAVSTEAGRSNVRRHDLAAALRTGEDGDAEHIIFFGVLGFLIFVGIELSLAVVAHECLRSDVKTQIPAAIRTIVHNYLRVEALCTKTRGEKFTFESFPYMDFQIGKFSDAISQGLRRFDAILAGEKSAHQSDLLLFTLFWQEVPPCGLLQVHLNKV